MLDIGIINEGLVNVLIKRIYVITMFNHCACKYFHILQNADAILDLGL